MNEEKSTVQTEANRRNAQLSTGPADTTATRYNAVKHGFRAEGLTELDNADAYNDLCARLKTEYDPCGENEEWLVQHIALLRVRLSRILMLEAEFITSQVNPPVTRTEGGSPAEDLLGKVIVVDPGLPVRLSSAAVEILCARFQRYETAIENKIYRAMHELERLKSR